MSDDVTVHHGDALDVLATMPDASVDACVTDPPYGLEFMGKDWDAPWAKGAGLGGNTAGLGEVEMADGANRLARPNYYGSPNPTCRNCGGLKRGSDTKKSQKACRCDAPRFDNVILPRMQAYQQWCEAWAVECLRLLKPGGHLLAFGGTRTFHRLACAVEDAGFEIRDTISWLYGSGFPKGSRVNRDERFCHCASSAHTNSHTSPAPPLDGHTRMQVDEAEAEDEGQSAHHATNEVLGSPGDCRPGCGCDGEPLHPAAMADQSSAPSQGCAPGRNRSDVHEDGQDDGPSRSPSPAPRTDHPSSQGYSDHADSASAVPASSPSSTSPADTSESAHRTLGNSQGSSRTYGNGFPLCTRCGKPNADGWNVALKPAWEPIIVARKPLAGTVAANVLTHGTGALNIDGCRIGEPEDKKHPGTKTYQRYDPGSPTKEIQVVPPYTSGRWPANVVLDEDAAAQLDRQTHGNVGSNSGTAHGTDGLIHSTDNRIFGAQNIDGTRYPTYDQRGDFGASRFYYTAKAAPDERPRVNGVSHPTVKPLDLIRWLVRLVTPPGGLVLDPFAGSGTTGEACLIEGFRVVLIEREADYLPLIEARLSKPLQPVLEVPA